MQKNIKLTFSISCLELKKKRFNKSGTLKYLNKKKYLKKNFSIPNFLSFTKSEFLKDEKKVINNIIKIFDKNIILRSSSFNEDTDEFTNAGLYKSYVIKKINSQEIKSKIDKIIKDFENSKDEIIAQEFLENVDLAGVAFSRDPNINAPYYIINYDTSGHTNKITSGVKNLSSATSVIYKDKKIKNKFEQLIEQIKLFENILQKNALDVEFAKKNNKWFIFQCRPLPIKKNFFLDNSVQKTLTNIEKKIQKLKVKNPNLSGKSTFFSNMSDWNPAEMLGTKPKPLAISLYAELITNSIWSKQRSNYGYKDVSPNPLMYNIAGSPFIDLRTDLNSFLPKNISYNQSEQIINSCLNKIKKNWKLHDKIEFNVIPTCFDFNIRDKFKISSSTYQSKLKSLTKDILYDGEKILNKELNNIKLLNKKISKITNSKLSFIQKIFLYSNDCKNFGTLPFAGIARISFICTQILNSLVEKKKITKEQNSEIFQSFNTITKSINNDYLKSKINFKEKKNFLKKYGHLRPSTYSISSLNFEEGYDLYFSKNRKKIKKNKLPAKLLKDRQLSNYFKKNDINITFKQFYKLCKLSVEGREYAKFIFSKSIDHIFKNLILLGNEIDIKRNDLEFIDFNLIINSHTNLNTNKLKKIILSNIKNNKASYQISSKIKLPDFIRDEKDIYTFEIQTASANYVTKLIVFAETYHLKEFKNLSNLNNKIVLIENADPGYDFIFSYEIKGLITKFGGLNSHMAIRCLELNIPAIIGIGEKSFEDIKMVNAVRIDCEQKTYNFIK